MSQTSLTPEQLNIAKTYVAKWVAIGLAVTPEGGTDRARVFKAQCALTAYIHSKPRPFVWLDLIPPVAGDPPDTVHVRWMTPERAVAGRAAKAGHPDPACARPVGHTAHVPKDWVGQAKQTVYIVTGSFDKLIRSAQVWTGRTDLSFHWLAGQYAVATSCYAHYVIDVFGVVQPPDILAKLECIDEYSRATGNALCYENVVFVSDHPVGHVRAADARLTPAWSDDHARSLGMIRQDDGTWEQA